MVCITFLPNLSHFYTKWWYTTPRGGIYHSSFIIYNAMLPSSFQ